MAIPVRGIAMTYLYYTTNQVKSKAENANFTSKCPFPDLNFIRAESLDI